MNRFSVLFAFVILGTHLFAGPIPIYEEVKTDTYLCKIVELTRDGKVDTSKKPIKTFEVKKPKKGESIELDESGQTELAKDDTVNWIVTRKNGKLSVSAYVYEKDDILFGGNTQDGMPLNLTTPVYFVGLYCDLKVEVRVRPEYRQFQELFREVDPKFLNPRYLEDRYLEKLLEELESTEPLKLEPLPELEKSSYSTLESIRVPLLDVSEYLKKLMDKGLTEKEAKQFLKDLFQEDK